jgi:hypothetical protein
MNVRHGASRDDASMRATSATADKSPPRLGGELPLFVDRIHHQDSWPSSWMAFSHGRAALAWLIKRNRIARALICAYTCPSVPEFLHRAGIQTDFFDVCATENDIAELAGGARQSTLVLLPSLFGTPPLQDAKKLAKILGRSAVVVIDAAQTAFGHRDFRPPPRGATLSCPRKTTSLADGAVLALGHGAKPEDMTNRPAALEATALKQAARALWSTQQVEFEGEAVGLNRRSEQVWPDGIYRMTHESRDLLRRLDAPWHRRVRRRNRRILAAAIAGRVPRWVPGMGTPFCLPVFLNEPDGLVAALGRERIFVSRLWPDARHDAERHPAAAYMTRHLVSLPVDQRLTETDMERIASIVLRIDPEPSPEPPPSLRKLII